MNHKKFIARGIALLLVVLIVSGCATPQVDTSPTTVQQTCPTSSPQSCPTSSAQLIPTMSAWRKYYYDEANIRITFDPGKKCSMDILSQAYGATLAYEVVVNDQAYQDYLVASLTLIAGKTLKDIEAYDNSTIGIVPPPPGSTLHSVEIVPPMSRTFHVIPMPYGQIYLTCLIQGPDQQQAIQSFGPVKISQ